MCSIGEDDFGDEGGEHAMIVDPKLSSTHLFDSEEICKKCNEHKVVVKLNLKDAQCEQCFFQYARHKFRASLGSTRIVQRGAKVALIIDGSIESGVMLDMVRYGLSQEKFKRLTIQPCVVYVDSTCTSGKSLDTRKRYIVEIFKLIEYFQFDAYYMSIIKGAPVVKIENSNSFAFDNNIVRLEEKFVNQIKSLRSITSTDDFLQTARTNAIRWAATQTDCKYAFVSSISHQIAANLLVNVALGRGSSVANEISFADSRDDDKAKIFRPLRNVTQLEIETYVYLNKNLNQLLQSINCLNIDKDICTGPCIQNLTKDFVTNLQENFASTVSTVFRTGDKIAAAASSTQSEKAIKTKETCKFCHSDLDFNDSATLFAIEYSRCVSACANRNEVNDVDLMKKRATNNVLGTGDDDELDNLMKVLCHGCRNIFRNLNDSEGFMNNVKS